MPAYIVLNRYTRWSIWTLSCIVLQDLNSTMAFALLSGMTCLFENATLTPNSSKIIGTVIPHQLLIYRLNIETHGMENMDIVVSMESRPENISVFSSENASYTLWLNTAGQQRLLEVQNQTILATTYVHAGSLDSCRPFTEVEQNVKCWKSYALIRLKLPGHIKNAPWYIGVSSVAQSLNYHLKAWYLDDGMSSQARRSLVSVGTIPCSDVVENHIYTADQITLTSTKREIKIEQMLLQPGKWRYFMLNISITDSRTLVEMSRTTGNVMLLVKPTANEQDPETLPSEFDAGEYADMQSYQNRQNYHHCFLVGKGFFFIAIYNNNACAKENSTVSLTITSASTETPVCLCPRNCSFPNGKCISDLLCLCNNNYGGEFCEGSLGYITPEQNTSGWLLPGQVAYFKVRPKAHDQRKWSMKFSYEGNSIMFLANSGTFPTLSNYTFMFMGNTSGDFEYYFDDKPFLAEDLIFGVFNLDYIFHEKSSYRIALNNPGSKGLKTGLMLLIAIGSSSLFCLLVATVEKTLHLSGSPNYENEDIQIIQSTEVLAIDTNARFSLVAYQASEVDEKGQCTICLNDYTIKEDLCKIPDCCHTFHADCIHKWLAYDNSCPICRITLSKTN